MELLNETFEVETKKSKEYTFVAQKGLSGMDVYAKVNPTETQLSPSGVSIEVTKKGKIVREIQLKNVAFAIGNAEGTYKVIIKNKNPLTVTGTVRVVTV